MAKTKKKNNGLDKNGSGAFKDVRKSKLFYFKENEFPTKTELADLRATVFTDRYSLKDDDGNPLETYPEQMWARVAKGIAQFERNKTLQDKWEKKFYKVMKDFKFVPAGRILSGAGTGYEVTFFNCYVIPSPPDSRGGIMENITQTVEIQSRAGGVGVNLSSLRPRGARVRKVNGTSSGPVNWAALYSTANHDVIQQGGSRRGALMLMLDDWHPDIEEFITVKEDLSKIPGANLSICVTDKFMDAVKADRKWDLIFPDYANTPDYDDVWDGDIDKWIESGRKVKVYKTVRAREIWDMIARAAWKSAEPGLHFIERSNKRSNTWYFEKLICTNPCGEQPLGAWAVCNLGAMNLTAYVKDNGEFDYDALDRDSAIAMRFMDNVVEANFYFYPETYESQMDIRRTGLGTMGLGDALIKMKVRYGSDESVKVIDKIYKTIRDSAYRTSALLGAEKGVFRKFDKDKYLEGWFVKRLPKDIRESIAKNGIRNAVLLTQAPTGTTSLLAGVSSGIEPVYNFEFIRKDRTGEHTIYHPLYEEWKKEHPGEPRPSYFVSAMDLRPEDHLKVQAKVQEYTDSSISKTVNAPNDYTIEDVKDLYTKAYEWGCKGITFFRDGSRQGVLENVKEEKPKETSADAPPATEKKIEDPEAAERAPEPMYAGSSNQMSLPVSPEAGARLINRPYVVHGSTYKLKTPVGTAFITINSDDAGEPLEMFINIGKAGSDVSAFAVALGRTISASLRFRSSLSPKERAMEIAEQLKDIGGRRSVGFGQNRIMSLPDAVSIALTHHFGFSSNGLRTNGHTEQKVALTQNETEQMEAGAIEPQDAGEQPHAAEAMLGAQQVMAMSVEPTTQVGAKVDLCPECGEHSLVFEEGCAKCYSCGHAEC